MMVIPFHAFGLRSLGIGMGSGGPGEEALDPGDGMGNGDVEEAG